MLDSLVVSHMPSVYKVAVAFQTITIAAIIILFRSAEKWGPALLGLFFKRAAAHTPAPPVCQAHERLVGSIEGLTKRADTHHREQREDFKEIKKLILMHEGELREHDLKIEFLERQKINGRPYSG
jgi:hypothetical protein